MLVNGKPTKLTFVPRGNNVLLERISPREMTEGGILLPDICREKTLFAKVIEVGPGKEIPYAARQSDTVFDPIYSLEVGDLVCFNIRHAIPCQPEDDGRLCIVDADHILAVVEQGD